MAPQRKRKHTSLEDQPSKQTASSKTQPDIQVFGSIGKPNVFETGLKKRKTIHQRDPTPPPTTRAPSVKADNKRKRDLETVKEEVSEGELGPASETSKRIFKQPAIRDVATPKSRRIKNVQPVDTPSRSAAALFEQMKLDVSTKAIPFALNGSQSAYNTPPYTPEAAEDTSTQLPKELDDLLMMHAAFLSALSMYYAHNGTTSPADVKTLLLMVTKSWKKRTVALDDLQILMAINQEVDTGFMLQDLGRAGVCLIKSQPRGRAMKRAASFVDEVDLNARFEDALRKRWRNWSMATPSGGSNATLFIDQLPLAEITRSEFVDKSAPVFARGQQRLAYLKASQAASQPESSAPAVITTEHKSTEAVQNRGSSLLDRVLAKQALTSSLPAGPTRKQLERKAALHRLEDIARVIDLLAAGRARCSFSMQAMVQHLQQSLRNPISKEEIQQCLSLMATEITPGFVSLVCSGAVMGVIVTRGRKVDLDELRQRVQATCA
ncbi:hypothetical protein LTR37_007781 [Vermiconidia calcicola]|uniref:Uncharacterized protein n=1 Tax=Vermiconidia calcicola TaxID=1690605 RepID=A0ACC3NFD5_9PEZI|nr:hypothetical protein LTR37_007781 [Vermiconidia calcicola]